jgi:hypothetical protein
MSKHLKLAWFSEPVPREANAPAPSAEDHRMTQAPPDAVDPQLVGQVIALT